MRHSGFCRFNVQVSTLLGKGAPLCGYLIAKHYRICSCIIVVKSFEYVSILQWYILEYCYYRIL